MLVLIHASETPGKDKLTFGEDIDALLRIVKPKFLRFQYNALYGAENGSWVCVLEAVKSVEVYDRSFGLPSYADEVKRLREYAMNLQNKGGLQTYYDGEEEGGLMEEENIIERMHEQEGEVISLRVDQ